MFVYITMKILIKCKTRHTTLSEKFQNPIENHKNCGKTDTPNTHDRSISSLGTKWWVKLVPWRSFRS
jgi:hypothetical protein